MKIPLSILIGCAMVACAIYLGLTHDKRTFMDACEDGKVAPGLNCEQAWLLYRK